MRDFYTILFFVIVAVLVIFFFTSQPEPVSPPRAEILDIQTRLDEMSDIETVDAINGTVPPSDIKSDERFVFFNTSARMSSDGTEWIFPIHGWVYEPEDSTFRKAGLAKALKEKYGLVATDKTSANFARRTNLFLADNERGKRLVVKLGDQSYALPASTPNGHVRAEIRVSIVAARTLEKQGAVSFVVVLPDKDGRVFSGKVFLTADRGISVISDIDDTVKVSEVTDRSKLLDHTFFRDFEAVDGMADVYSRWSKTGARIHFVSSSPWQLYEPLTEFLKEKGFPPATLSLKSIRFKDSTILNLFKKGTETKPLQIEPILEAYPNRRFVLIGDSGEQDPEVYAGIMRKHPNQILRIYIRNVDDSADTDERVQEVFRGIDAKNWKLFDDPGQLELPTPKVE